MNFVVYANDQKYHDAATPVHVAMLNGGMTMSADLTIDQTIEFGMRLIQQAEKMRAEVIAAERAQDVALRVMAIVARQAPMARAA